MLVRERVQELLAERGWSQSQLARRLHEHRNWVNNRMTGETDIKADELTRIADALEVHPCAFFPAPEPSPDQAPAGERMAAAWAQRALGLEARDIELLARFLRFLREEQND